jgi:hypothetical protein
VHDSFLSRIHGTGWEWCAATTESAPLAFTLHAALAWLALQAHTS